MWGILYARGNIFGKVLGTLRGYMRRFCDVFRVAKYDLVYVHMWVTPFGTTFSEKLYRIMSKRLIYDIEDNIFAEKGNSINPITTILKGTRKARYLIKTADHVITSSPALNDFCLVINRAKSCTYISSSVDCNRFVPKNEYNNDNEVTIGWTGTFSSRKYLDTLKDVFLELNDRVSFKLRVIGNFHYDLPGINLEVIQWTKENEVLDLQGIDIGIYPLVHDDFVQGKSGLKAIQYMAFGLPTVATKVGTTPRIIKHQINGWLVDSDSEWLYALETLIKDPNLRRSMGEAARSSVLKNYSTDVVKSNYLAILESLTGTEI